MRCTLTEFQPVIYYIELQLLLMPASCPYVVGSVFMALDSEFSGCEFVSWPLHCRVTTLGKLYTLICQSEVTFIQSLPLFMDKYYIRVLLNKIIVMNVDLACSYVLFRMSIFLHGMYFCASYFSGIKCM